MDERRFRAGRQRVWLLTAAVALPAGALYGWVVRSLDPVGGPVRIPWPLLAAGFALAEVCVVHLQRRRGAFSFSLGEIPLAVGLFTVPPGDLVLANLVGAAVAVVAGRRQSPMKLTFNLAHLTLSACLAVALFHGLLTGPRAGTLLSALGALLLAALARDVLSAAVVGMTEGSMSLRSVLPGLGFGAVVSLANTSVALLALLALAARPEAAWLLVVPAAAAFLAYRGYASQRQQHETLRHLYESTRRLQGSLDVEAAAQALLREVREIFRAEIAELLLLRGRDGESGARVSLGPGDEESAMHPVALDPLEGVWARVAQEGRGILVPRSLREDGLRPIVARRAVRDLMAAPVLDEDAVIGVITVANREGEAATFDADDLGAFEMLVNHASVSLKNAQLVTRLEQSLDRLTEMSRMKDDFIATVSHELRTPLASVLGFVKLLRQSGPPLDEESRDEFLRLSEQEALRLHELIEDLLAVTKMDHGDMRPSIRAVDVRDLVDSLARGFAPRASHRLKVRAELLLPAAWTDEGLLRKILSNFVDNAMKYSPDGTPVTLRVRGQEGGVLVSVADRGPGIPPHERERVFDRFYQVDQSIRRRVGGTGLGLYICRRAAEVIGGRVWLEESGPGGSVFSVWVPAVGGRAAAGERDADAPRWNGEDPANGKPGAVPDVPVGEAG